MINKLITRIKETNAPIVVGLDPMMKFVPEYIKKAAFTEYGETLSMVRPWKVPQKQSGSITRGLWMQFMIWYPL